MAHTKVRTGAYAMRKATRNEENGCKDRLTCKGQILKRIEERNRAKKGEEAQERSY